MLTEHDLHIKRHLIAGRKKYLSHLLKEARKVRREIEELEEEYEIAENEFMFGKEGDTE